MRSNFNKVLAVTAVAVVTLVSAHAQTLTHSWTFDGGAFDPATYGGNFKPSALVEAANPPGSVLSIANYGTAPGLGSSNFPDGYGFFYNLNSTTPVFTIDITNVLADVDTITLSFWAGDYLAPGFGTNWSQTFLTLDYGDANPAVVAVDYSKTPAEGSDFGTASIYSWTFDVSGLAATTEFSVVISGFGPHTPIKDISVVQVVPEPTVVTLAALGASGMLFLRRRSSRSVVKA